MLALCSALTSATNVASASAAYDKNVKKAAIAILACLVVGLATQAYYLSWLLFRAEQACGFWQCLLFEAAELLEWHRPRVHGRSAYGAYDAKRTNQLQCGGGTSW